MKLKIRAADFILIFILLVIGCVPFFFFWGQPVGKQVVIRVDGQVYGVYSLKEDQTISLENIGDVVIESGCVFVRNTSCPDHLCDLSDILRYSFHHSIPDPAYALLILQ